MLKKRIISSVILIALTIAIIFFLPNWIFVLAVATIIGLALYEFFSLVQRKGIPIYKPFGVVVGMCIPLFVYFRFEPTQKWELAFMVALCLILFLLQFMRRSSTNALSAVAITCFGILYLGWFSSFIIKLKLIADPSLPAGSMLVAFLILVSKLGDIGAYLIGSRFGKHVLIPRISPKKSVEGSIGGFIFSLAGALISKAFLPSMSYLHLIVLGILLGILTQIGDLSESLIKRDCATKDSNTIFPGLGGILDLIDSLLFATPVLYFYIRILL